MKNFFYSLKASYILFWALAAIFGIGSHLANKDSYDIVFRKMTSTHIWTCLGDIIATPVLLLWLSLLVLVGACLFVNTLCCTKTQIQRFCAIKRQGNTREKRIKGMAYIHIVAIIVIACHALDILLVERHEAIKVRQGSTVSMGEFDISLNTISFVTDRSVITENEKGRRMKSFRIPRKDFSLQDNFAEIEISQNGEVMATERLAMLAPARLGGTFFFLDGFFIEQGKTEIGIELHHSYNPLALPFFLVYTVLFSLLLIQFFVARQRDIVRDNENDF